MNFIKEKFIKQMETIMKEILEIINLMVKAFTNLNVDINILVLFKMA
jgi:hypothetical protein